MFVQLQNGEIINIDNICEVIATRNKVQYVMNNNSLFTEKFKDELKAQQRVKEITGLGSFDFRD